MDEVELTAKQAYRAMLNFLEQEYERTKSDDIAGLLSSLSWEITSDAGPADPGAWQDWMDAVKKAIA
ncbi:hypothetical protein [Herbaspirillum huttiense]|uniref:hypothetical protein n=1 Tax=Herbaspirillum huttiense TaxID=863372 RepID=UPI00058453D1|nr:hypothetical protein [Herbaspirillum huttiense]MBN9359557.1 hypothetical protein [Herbaspirillum huttiense]